MEGGREFISALGALQQGIVDEGEWKAGLDGVCRLFDGAFSVVEIRRRDRPEVAIETSTVDFDAKIRDSYNSYYGLICPRAAALPYLREGEVMHDGLVGGEAVLDRDEYYADFLAPQGLRYFLASSVRPLADVDVVISVQRLREAGRADRDEIARFGRLAPLLADAYALRLTFAGHASVLDALEQAAGRVTDAFLVLAADGRPLYVSKAASHLITASGPWLGLGPAGLTAVGRNGSAFSRQLGKALAGAGRGGLAAIVPEAGLRLRILPVRGDTLAPVLARAAAVVVIERLRTEAETLTAALTRAFGLTPREAEIVADLCAGLEPKEIAEARALSIATVRTHIARAREKAGARSISALVGLAARAAAKST